MPEFFLVLGIHVTIAAIALVKSISARRSFAGFLGTATLIGYLATYIFILSIPSLGAAVIAIWFGPLALPFSWVWMLQGPLWYLPVFFLPPTAITTILVLYKFKIRAGSLGAVTCAMIMFAGGYLNFSIYLAFEIPRAAQAVPGQATCFSRQSTWTVVAGGHQDSIRPHALLRTKDATYIYSFSERRFVQVRHGLAPKTPCHPLAQ
jgi:hypothetical protein